MIKYIKKTASLVLFTVLVFCIVKVQDIETVNALENKGYEYYKTGDYIQAEKYWLEAKEIREKVLGKEHPDYAASLNNLGALYDAIGNYAQAEKYYLEAKEIHEKVLGKEHPSYATSLNNLGLLYDDIGNYAQAEKYYLEAKEIREKVLGKEHPDYAISLNNLGALYMAIGNYAQAEKYYSEAKEIFEKVLGKEHPSYATSLDNLGALYDDIGNYAQAEKYYLEAKKIREKVLGKEHPSYAASLNNLGLLYNAMGNYAQAEKYFLEAKEIIEKVLGKEHPNYAKSLNNLGGLYDAIGNYAQAEKYFLEAKETFEKVLGKEHPSYAISLHNLFGLYYDIKDYKKAITFGNTVCELSIRATNRNFAFMSKQQRGLYWKTQAYRFEFGYSLSWVNPAAETNNLNYNNTLFTKGLLLRTATAVRDAIYSSGNQTLIGQYERLGNLRKEITTLQQKTDFNKEYVASLESRADSLDKALTQASVAFRDLKADMSMQWQDVQKQLNPEDVAIEFVSFSLYDKKWTDTTLYAALVLRKGMKSPVWIPLFNETELQACLKTEFDNDSPSAQKEAKRIGKIYRANERAGYKGIKLYRLVWEKLGKELQGVKNVYYSPSGLLHKVSFDAIPVDTASTSDATVTLYDKYNMYLVTSTREIKRLKTEHPETWSPKDSTAIYGGLQYYLHEDTMRLVAETYRSRGTGGTSWVYLEGSEKEAKEVEALMKEKSIKTTLFTGIYGNEESFKHLSGTKTKVILLSTHGFFLSDVEHKHDLLQSLGGGNQRGGTNNPHGAVENPLLRSGLILSGGGTKWDEPGRVIESGLEDGILTAEEVSRLNLTNTKLVVLSACESGLGDAKNSEGVFGLQRAFKLAGIETIIMSLWQVSDNATNLLMTTFFTEWLSGKTKHDAFKTAQTKVREKFAAPYYWAAFVMLD